jgi:hypothetical protein
MGKRQEMKDRSALAMTRGPILKIYDFSEDGRPPSQTDRLAVLSAVKCFRGISSLAPSSLSPVFHGHWTCAMSYVRLSGILIIIS